VPINEKNDAKIGGNLWTNLTVGAVVLPVLMYYMFVVVLEIVFNKLKQIFFLPFFIDIFKTE